MSIDDFSTIFFFEQQIPLDVMLKVAEYIPKLKEEISASSSPYLIDELFHGLFLLGTGFIKSGIYGQGVKCYEEALTLINQNPSQYFVALAVPPLQILRDNVPIEFSSILHTLTIYYYRTEQLEKFADVIVHNIFVERGSFFKTWLCEVSEIEAFRRACLKLRSRQSFKDLVGVTREWYTVLDKIQTVAKSDDPVLITGPSGVGKEVVAKAIHAESGRNKFIPVNCAAINDELIVSELFGTEKGAFTGAIESSGLCMAVGSGTLFLDEIGISSPNLQGKLLRLLQEREFMSVGGRKPLKFEGRIIAATNRDIPKLIRDGVFLQDLYWRLNVHEIMIPPLSKRPLDIEELILHFIKTSGKNKKISVEAADAIYLFYEQREVQQAFQEEITKTTDDRNKQIERLKQMGIPADEFLENNVRELKNEITRLLIEEDTDYITLKHLPKKYTEAYQRKPTVAPYYYIPTYVAQSKKCQKEDLKQALAFTGNSQTKVAALFGCTPQAINQRKTKFSL